MQSVTSKFRNVTSVDGGVRISTVKDPGHGIHMGTHSSSVNWVGRQGKLNYNILVGVKSLGRAQSGEEKSSCFLSLLDRLLLVSKRCDEDIQEALGNGLASKVLVV